MSRDTDEEIMIGLLTDIRDLIKQGNEEEKDFIEKAKKLLVPRHFTKNELKKIWG